MFDYYPNKTNAPSVFDYNSAEYELSDYLKKTGAGRGVFNLIYEFLNGEHEDVSAVFDVNRFNNFIYTYAARYATGDNLSRIKLCEEPYTPAYRVVDTILKKEKCGAAAADGGEIGALKGELADVKAALAQIMGAVKNGATQQGSAGSAGSAAKHANKRGDTGSNGGDSQL